MKRSRKATAVKHIKAHLAAFQETTDDIRKTVEPELLAFLISLGSEGERSAVVLGAERINVAVEMLLKSFLLPSPNKDDRLFTTDGAVSTFSRKVELAHRLCLMDSSFKQALDLIRKLRNEFAHATEVESLEQQNHADKVRALSKLVVSGNEKVIEGFYQAFQESSEALAVYMSCIMLLLVKLEIVRHHLKPPEILLPAKLNYKSM